MEMNYCRRCGAKMKVNDTAFTCVNDHTLYANPAPTVGVFLLTTEGNVVLSVRGIEPGKGGLDTIGGFVDENESFEHAIEREIFEETSLQPNDYSTLTYLTSAPSTYDFGGESRSVLTCFYYASLTAGAVPVASDDVAELVSLPVANIVVDDMWSSDTRIATRALLEVIT